MASAHRAIAALGLAAALALAYAVTLAPGLTWLHESADGGDLIAAAASGGVPHPTGYPTYGLLARLFLRLPISNPAWRTNALSATVAVLAAVIVADTVRVWHRGRFGLVAGTLAGFAFGLSPLLWSQAVVTEVYALHACFIAALLRVLPTHNISHQQSSGWGALCGLALGNHLTAIFVLPVGLWQAWNSKERGRSALTMAVGLLLGLSVYGLLPLWASSQPAINWGGAQSADGMWWLISGEPYRGLVFEAGEALPQRLLVLGNLYLDQFGLLLLIVGVWAFIQPSVSNEHRLLSLWLILIVSGFALGYNTTDSYIYLLPAFVVAAIWIGLGLATLFEHHSQFAPVILAIAILAVLWNAVSTLPGVDASRNNAAQHFGESVLQAAPPHAILVTGSDRDTFTLWYFQEALGARPDVSILAKRLLPFDWYREQFNVTYPDVKLPAATEKNLLPALIGLNDRPVCRTVLDGSVVLECNSESGR